MEILQQLLDACFYGKQITELMPSLPKKLKPRHMSVIGIIHALQEKQNCVRVSDVSHALRITPPSITKLINELTDYGIVEKHAHTEDKRTLTLTLTELGMEYFTVYVLNCHKELVQILEPIQEEDCAIAIKTMEKMYRLMKAHPIQIERSERIDRKKPLIQDGEDKVQ
ncbi:MarR family transcriptional regulator [Caproicibacterium sp. BJN0003]|uniref:MarR family transcriptional regulator n=1 Tax=Caproicibacterium sp. BJN0003 TaxID=2994078 RepID=UPI00224DB5C8|nr:helix-turn-helix domain-containing protein [Caproicibacterium sp. BJN0003]UZT83439.1 helix-turn-helix domain-containing protein [Caproicibacterium sp. BJN0003]